MPKAPVHENRHPRPANDDVRRARQPPIMSSEMNSMLTEEFLNEPLWMRI
jgi:hypothetical protein